ncbi:MAG: hypothetical protein ACYCST_08025 [Acidimicrobiales bacterium]
MATLVSSAREMLTAAGIEEAEDHLVVDPGIAGDDRDTSLEDHLRGTACRDQLESRPVARDLDLGPRLEAQDVSSGLGTTTRPTESTAAFMGIGFTSWFPVSRKRIAAREAQTVG